MCISSRNTLIKRQNAHFSTLKTTKKNEYPLYNFIYYYGYFDVILNDSLYICQKL